MLVVSPSARIYQPTVILEENHEIRIGDRCSIGQLCFIAPRKLVMEEGVEICPQVTVSGGGEVYMDKYSSICFGARIIPATWKRGGGYWNDNAPAEKKGGIVRGQIFIEEGAYIGSNAVICVSEKHPVIRVGSFAVVGAFSYVGKDVPDHSFVHPEGVVINP